MKQHEVRVGLSVAVGAMIGVFVGINEGVRDTDLVGSEDGKDDWAIVGLEVELLIEGVET